MRSISKYNIEDLKQGDSYTFDVIITKDMVDGFADLSEDYSTIHMDDSFAKNRGFDGRIVHGILMLSFLSRLVGMHFPGRNAILQAVNVRFVTPSYIGDHVKISGTVDQRSVGTNTLVLKVNLTNLTSGDILLDGKFQVGFTSHVS